MKILFLCVLWVGGASSGIEMVPGGWGWRNNQGPLTGSHSLQLISLGRSVLAGFFFFFKLERRGLKKKAASSARRPCLSSQASYGRTPLRPAWALGDGEGPPKALAASSPVLPGLHGSSGRPYVAWQEASRCCRKCICATLHR